MKIVVGISDFRRGRYFVIFLVGCLSNKSNFLTSRRGQSAPCLKVVGWSSKVQ